MIREINVVIPRRPYRFQRMRAINNYKVMKEKRERTSKKSAMSKGRNLLHESWLIPQIRELYLYIYS